MTLQEIFDTSARHLLAQGKQARSAMGPCMYRTADGLKCALGVFFPDDMDTSGFEGTSISGDQSTVEYDRLMEALDTVMPGVLDDLTGCTFELLEDLQDAHDNFLPGHASETFNVQITRRLRWVAQNYNLSVDALDA